MVDAFKNSLQGSACCSHARGANRNDGGDFAAHAGQRRATAGATNRSQDGTFGGRPPERTATRRRESVSAVLVLVAIASGATFALGDAGLVRSADRPASGADRVRYNRDVRPILRENCFACHGPDSAARKADLRLDLREEAIAAAAIVPGKPDESELVRRILSQDPDEQMPPPELKKHLTDEQKATLVRWIREGAEYEPHWSLIPPQRPPLPDVAAALAEHHAFSPNQRAALAAWPRNAIDRFVLVRMLDAGLVPEPEADRRTLARRVSLDLIGLPPSPEDLEAFVNDPRPDAYERFVDRLLASPHWGEHRGRYWLDAARYADTHGYHFDNYREMWSYRDWVIKAFNENMTFDRFTIENLAGDLLPNATLDQKIASGFNRCNMTTNEGGIIDEEYLVLYTRDRTETVAKVWLGMTANCAVCHDHKFDPLTQREFYQMAAFFNNTTQKARDGNIKDTPPVIRVPLPEDRVRWEELPELIAAARQARQRRREQARPAFERWLRDARPDQLKEPLPAEGLHVHAPFGEGRGAETVLDIDGEPRRVALQPGATWTDGPNGAAIAVEGSVLELPDAGRFDGKTPFTCAAWIKVPAAETYGAICARMDNTRAYRGWDFWMQRRQIGTHIINSWSSRALKVVARTQVPANRWVHVAVTYDGSQKASGVKVYYDGKPQPTNVEADRLSVADIEADVPFRIGQRHSSEPFLGSLSDLRIYRRALAPGEVERLAGVGRIAAILAKPAGERTAAEREALFAYWLNVFDAEYQRLDRRLTSLETELRAIEARGTVAHIMQERPTPAFAYVLFRGDYDKRREKVRPDVPSFLPPFPEGAPRNRLGFAQWLLLPEHPLMARVTVNRFWQEVFGTGIVRTAGDFGIAGELPSHPQLLDWLAVEFRETGWDVKRLFRLMVTSATYRQRAAAGPEKWQRDAENRLLARGPRFRMDAEMIRDYALAASGLLVPRIGGPSVKPYQPPGVWEAIAMNVSNTRKYVRGTGEDLYRRSVYTFIKRMAPPPAMDIFNAPNREYCVVRRDRTNTALQALVTLNDEQFVEAARVLAQRALTEGGTAF
ncbi:MAG: DUF1553 domain-containing protein, partial [Planctomycetota bacterium]